MCGIAAMVSRVPRPAEPIQRMADLVRHRGPDDEGFLLVPAVGGPVDLYGGPSTPGEAFASHAVFAPSRRIEQAAGASAVVAFGHRRLSILDLSVNGHQPMCTANRRYWIIYNGEIYNYRELGDELARLGHRFVSRCDTEVILAAFAEWGDACLERLNGMWAFIIYDSVTADIFAARDRFGIKPLYYWTSPDDTLYFASEIKQFTAAPGWGAAINAARAGRFLETGLTDCGDETLFDRVFQLRPGECARLPVAGLSISAEGRIPVRRWYELRAATFRGSFDDAAAECRRLLEDSVRLMLRSDVPVGSCLSGGIDSSSIVCLIGRALAHEGTAFQQKVFSARSESPQLDEQRWVDEVIAATGVDAFSVSPTVKQLQDRLPTLVWHQDEPFTSTSVFAQWAVFERAAAAGMKVMLDGQGADEAFAGYHSFFAPYLATLVRDGRPGAAWREMRALETRHGYRALTALAGILRVLAAGAAAPAASVKALSHAQLTQSNLQMLLRFEDRNSMAHSVEARVPFLDHRVVEFALGLPDQFKIGGGVTKRVLRSAMSGVLPDRIRDRVDKIGFETAEADWIAGSQRPWFRTELEAAIEISDRFVPASMLIGFDAMAAGRTAYDRRFWRAIAFGHWMRAFRLVAPTRARWQPA